MQSLKLRLCALKSKEWPKLAAHKLAAHKLAAHKLAGDDDGW